MKSQPTRKKVYVNRDIQGKILRRVAKYWIGYHLGLWHVLFLIQFFRYGTSGLTGGPGPMNLWDLYLDVAREQWVLLILPIALFPAILWDMLRLTHQVAGPLVRFRAALRQLAAGEKVEQIKLREGDLLTEFQEAFNEFLASPRMQNEQRPQPAPSAESSAP
jgi:hypothetical protein